MKTFLKVLKVIGLFIVYLVYMCEILVLVRHGLNYFYNGYVLSHYEKSDYSINDNLLLTLNCLEPYVVYFNNGDIYYKNSLYDDAIESFETALEYDYVPEERRCMARINISLSMIGKLPEDYDTYENIPDSLELLHEAADNLLEEGCAAEDGKGHSEDAQTLYDEIMDEIERLEQIQEEQEQQQQQQPQDGEGEGDPQNPDGQDGQGGGTVDPSGQQQPDDGDGQQPDDGDEQQDPDQMTFEEYEEYVQQQLEQEAQEAYEEHVNELQEYQEWNVDWWSWDEDYDGIW